MGSKRAAGDEGGNAPKKRRDQNHFRNGRGVGAMDANYGQRAVFGDHEILTTVPTEDSDLDCEDDAEALAYLRAVR